MAPEMFHKLDDRKKTYSGKVDIWSLGCVVLEMWTGRRPWGSSEAITVMVEVSVCPGLWRSHLIIVILTHIV
jgi:mitogen-activated protein kinase kinase kinase